MKVEELNAYSVRLLDLDQSVRLRILEKVSPQTGRIALDGYVAHLTEVTPEYIELVADEAMALLHFKYVMRTDGSLAVTTPKLTLDERITRLENYLGLQL